MHNKRETSYQFDLLHDGLTGFKLNDPPTGMQKSIDRVVMDHKYATTWKLTAITGPDFLDSNADGLPNSNDLGYWIRFDYGRWADDFEIRYPVFGFQQDLTRNSTAANYTGVLSIGSPHVKNTGTAIQSEHEVYYLNRIVTASHSALFFHDVRFDEHSVEQTPKPLLKLSEVILIKNEQIPNGALSASTDPTPGPFAPHSQTDVAQENIYNSNHLNDGQIRSHSLASIRLDHDYSLARRHRTNIYSGYATHYFEPNSARDWCGTIYYEEPTSVSPIDYSKSGKLTLKRIRSFGFGGVPTQPGTDYTYYDNLLIDGVANPLDAEPSKKDHFGHFKYDHDPFSGGGYTTKRSARYVHAWGLHTITDPSGGTVMIEYEPDIYSLVGYGSVQGKPPTRYYPIRDIITQSNGPEKIWLLDIDGVREFVVDPDNEQVSAVALYYGLSCPLNYHVVGSVGLDHAKRPVRNVELSPVSNSPQERSMEVVGIESPLVPEVCTLSSLEGEFLRATYRFQYGGGLRVKRINMPATPTSPSVNLEFQYEGGVCAAEPDPFDTDRNGIDHESGNVMIDRYITMDRSSGDRHAPSSTVGYTIVRETAVDAFGERAGGNEYEFGNFVNPYTMSNYRARQNGHLDYYEVTHCRVGGNLYAKPLRTSVLDRSGNTISQTIFRYENEPSSVIEEVFNRAGSFPNTTGFLAGQYGINVQSAYVKALKFRKLVAIEHHENSQILVTRFSDFDHNTGEPLTTTITQDGVGTRTMTTIPAYSQIPELGAKWVDPSNKNILTPAILQSNSTGTGSMSDWSATNAIRAYDPVSGSFTSSMSTTEWVPTKNYVRSGIGTEDWKFIGKNTLFGPSMAPLEQKDMAQGYSATKLTLSGQFPVAEVSNCNHASHTYCAFERTEALGGSNDPRPWFDGELTADDPNGISLMDGSGSIVPHSGAHCIAIQPNAQAVYYRTSTSTRLDPDNEVIETGLLKGRTYRAVVWVHANSPSSAKLLLKLTGSYTVEASMAKNDPEALVVGNWIRLVTQLTVPSDFTGTPSQGLRVSLENPSSTQTAYFDDLLLHPVDASVRTACWDESTGLLSATMTASGFVTQFTYDAAGRTIEVRQETETGLHKVEESEVGYQKSF